MGNQYTFFNCGSPNRICIVLGGYKSKDTQTPKAYMELIIKNNFYYTDEQHHIRMIDYEFVFFKKGIFNMETKEKIIKLKGKDFYLERVLKEDNDICIMISKIKNLPKRLFEQYINFSPYEEVMEHVSKELTKSKIETYEDLDFFD